MKRILKGLWSGFTDNLEAIIGGLFVAIPVEFTLRVLAQPASFAEEVILVITAVVLGFLIASILSHFKSIKNIILASSPGVYPNQSSSDLPVLLFIAQQRPRKARMLEYSSSTVHGIISNLVTVDCKIQLLLQHPKNAVNTDESKKICAQIRAYYDELEHYPHLRIRCYRERASFRGRNFDGRLIQLGWYTYNVDKGATSEKIYGHTNPLVYSVSEHKKFFEPLSEWFDRVFNQYWQNASRLTEVINECEELRNLNIPEAWFRIVSQDTV